MDWIRPEQGEPQFPQSLHQQSGFKTLNEPESQLPPANGRNLQRIRFAVPSVGRDSDTGYLNKENLNSLSLHQQSGFKTFRPPSSYERFCDGDQTDRFYSDGFRRLPWPTLDVHHPYLNKENLNSLSLHQQSGFKTFRQPSSYERFCDGDQTNPSPSCRQTTFYR